MPHTEEIIEQALHHIGTGYVFPEKAERIGIAIRRRRADGAYDGLDGPALCAAVTADLQEVCPDKHMRLLWSAEPLSLEPEDQDAGRAAFLALLRSENQGVRRVETLDDGVAVVRITYIPGTDEGAPAMGAAMQLAAGSTALVLDLRSCRGGMPEGAAMWCSYFFPDDQTHLNDIHDGPTGTTRQYWTAGHLPAPRYLDRPVYILTSALTFSGGEDVAYTLQAHGRATLVGETTRGGAHPTVRHTLTEHIQVTVPIARTVNTVTGGNWEGVGVTPDLPAPADQALETALKALATRTASAASASSAS
ncbi:S41 family peptidase [Streptomyces sp. NPDC047014]|uniref:S41 family peptidase n=1 Tax=Streptomyces sp. NPDC047014 TaxID=3155736 RepID=UPI0033CF9F65